MPPPSSGLPLVLALVLATGPGRSEAETGGDRPKAPRETSRELPREASLDLAGYFADGPFEEAGRLVARGDVRAAAELLRRKLREAPDALERPQARFLLGLSLIQLEEHEEAAHIFEELAVTYPVLRDEHLFFRGEALFRWGSYLQAAEVLADVDPAGPRGIEARRLRARALLEATDFEHLLRWLEELDRAEPLEPELRFTLARARHRTGDVLGAFRALREVWREAPAGKLAGPALVYLASLKLGDRPMLAERERRAIKAVEARLSSGRDVDGAMAELEKGLAGAPETARLRAEVAYARGRLADGQGHLSVAERHYARALELAPPDSAELRAKVTLDQAEVAARLGHEPRALELYQTVAELFAERAEAETARMRAAEILLSARRYREANAALEALLLANPVTTHRPRALWGMGWAHFRLGEYERARQSFGSLTRLDLTGDIEVASRYWLARTEATLGHGEVAASIFRDVVRRHPLSHYAALAEDQLAERIGDAPLETAEQEAEVKGSVEPKELVEVREYARLGLRSRAVARLAAYEAQVRRAKRAVVRDRPVLRTIARLFDELGQNGEARRVREDLARRDPAGLGSEELLALWRRTLPIKFEPEIRAAADSQGVSDALLLGLIRTESGFHPDAVSGMSAFGLSQLVLSTAEKVAKEQHLPRPTRARLLREPGYNVRLGAAYLRDLLDHYGGSEPLALAAYNAGPTAVDGWLASRVRVVEGVGEERGVGIAPGPDELTEEIPVPETRAFVKNVLARARAYAKVYPRATVAEEPIASPLVEAGALTEPADLPGAPRETSALPHGARVVGEGARDELAERIYGARAMQE